MQHSDRTYVLLDHTKFNRRALFKFADLQEFDHVVVDSKTSPEVLRHLEETGVQVRVAQP